MKNERNLSPLSKVLLVASLSSVFGGIFGSVGLAAEYWIAKNRELYWLDWFLLPAAPGLMLDAVVRLIADVQGGEDLRHRGMVVCLNAAFYGLASVGFCLLVSYMRALSRRFGATE